MTEWADERYNGNNTKLVQYTSGVSRVQFNQATDYAFRVILHLAASPPGEIVNGQTIAQREQIPLGFLQKIMRALAGGGLVRSYRGAEGGFQLAKDSGDISLLDVVTIMEGQVNIHRCLDEKESCNKRCGNMCPVHDALAHIQRGFVEGLGKVRFSQLAENYQNKEEKA